MVVYQIYSRDEGIYDAGAVTQRVCDPEDRSRRIRDPRII
jgi:hypothetical protein